MSKFNDFLYKAGNILIDAVGEAANETIQNKISEKCMQVDKKHQQKKQEKKIMKEKIQK